MAFQREMWGDYRGQGECVSGSAGGPGNLRVGNQPPISGFGVWLIETGCKSR